jgi:hypothetical protein
VLLFVVKRAAALVAQHRSDCVEIATPPVRFQAQQARSERLQLFEALLHYLSPDFDWPIVAAF